MRRPVVSLLAAVVVTGLAVLAGLLVLGRGGHDDAPRDAGGTPSSGSTEPPFTTTPLIDVDTTRLAVARGSFCSRIDPRQVTAALGAAVASQRSWHDGDRTVLGSGVKDVAHEFGCEYVAADGTAARAWVFAPPVTRASARGLVSVASAAKGCHPSTLPPFGSPSVGLTCSGPGGAARASYRGLFGDAWLTCEVELPAADKEAAGQLPDRAGRWCVGVLRAAGAS